MSEHRRIVLTGGPGAGKTAVLELARRHFAHRVVVLHESASILFGGGFPRSAEPKVRASGQRAIYHVQVELERLALEAGSGELVLCDRGTLDGLAYWPYEARVYFDELHTTYEAELARYDAVIHLRTPTRKNGYHKDALRVEAVREAESIDERLLEVWRAHPRRFVIESTHDFIEKAQRTMAVIESLGLKVAA